MNFKYEISVILLISLSHLIRSQFDFNTIKNLLVHEKPIKCHDCNGEGNPDCAATINESTDKNKVKVAECEKGAQGCATQLAEIKTDEKKVNITNRGCYYDDIEKLFQTNFSCGRMANDAGEKRQICHKCRGDLCNFKNADEIVSSASDGRLIWIIIAVSFVLVMIVVTCLINKCV